MKRFLVLLSVAIIALGVVRTADASVVRQTTYRESIVWRCAVRLVRVDLGYKLIEKDQENGYLLFQYKEGEQLREGAIEILPVENSGKRYVRVQINLQNQPSYIESVLYNKLEKKLKNEYGTPPAAELVDGAVLKLPGRGGDSTAASQREDQNSDSSELDEAENSEDSSSKGKKKKSAEGTKLVNPEDVNEDDLDYDEENGELVLE